jgi:chorismate mutase-like protein
MAAKRGLKAAKEPPGGAGEGGDPRAPQGEPEIEAWRRRIDSIDDQLMRLLNSRSACAVEIGRIKRVFGLPVYSPDREAWILDRLMRDNPGPLEAMAVRRVIERIIDESRRLERLGADARDRPWPEGGGDGSRIPGEVGRGKERRKRGAPEG